MNLFAISSRRSRRSVGLRALVVAALVAACLVSSRIWADPKGPQSNDRQVAMIVARALREHLSKMPLDDEISKRTFSSILKTLDPLKIYFVQTDIDEFAKDETNLDDMLKKGDVSFIYKVFNRLLERIDQRVALVDDLLKIEPDYTIDEEIVIDPKQAVYATNDAEMHETWRKLIKYELLLKKLDAQDEETRQKKLDEAKLREPKPEKPTTNEAQLNPPKPSEKPVPRKTPQEQVAHKYHGIAKLRHQMNGDDLLEIYLNSLAMSYDPHTDFMSASSNDQFESRMSLHYDGIGAILGSDYGTTKITELVPGGAAAKDGRLKAGDLLVGVGQDREGDIIDVADMNNNDIVKLIRGKAGTIVRLKVNPAAGGDTKVIDITRASIELKDSEARGEIIDLPAEGSTEKTSVEAPAAERKVYKIGVIDLPSFYMDMTGARLGLSTFRSTSRDLEKILRDFTEKNVDAVVLDLRRNGGGSLLEAVKVTGLFIDQGPVVQVKDSRGKIEQLDDTDPGVAWAGPLVVLQSKLSASASEIFAGAIQDYSRGLIVGDRTSHGKGLVQTVIDISKALFGGMGNAPSMGALKITIQQFYRPDGESTQNRGVPSDVILPSITSYLPVGESDLDYAMKFDQIAPAKYKNTHLVEKDLIEQLRSRSAARVEKSDEFKKVQRKIDRYQQFLEHKTASLNEKKFTADRAELNADQEEEKQIEQLDDSTRPVVNRDYYFNEVLAVTRDYLQLGKAALAN
jgi:carboxyl-terminal processing protease